MNRRSYRFVKKMFASRCGQTLAVLNISALFLLWLKFPFIYAPPQYCHPLPATEVAEFCYTLIPDWEFLEAYFLINAPATFLTVGLSELLTKAGFCFCLATRDTIDFLAFVVSSSFQWLLIGFGLQKIHQHLGQLK